MRALNLDVIRKLWKCGFGTVYEAKKPADRLKVAVKIVKDPQNAIQAIREGQRQAAAHEEQKHRVHAQGARHGRRRLRA